MNEREFRAKYDQLFSTMLTMRSQLTRADEKVENLTRELAAAQAGRLAMHTAVGELLEAIDAVESEPGRSGEPIFAVDWKAQMNLVKDRPDTQALQALMVTCANLGYQDGEAGSPRSPAEVVEAVLRGDE